MSSSNADWRLPGTSSAKGAQADVRARPKGRPGRKPKGSVPVVVAGLRDKPDPDHVLTWRQRKVLQVIGDSVERRGYPPSMREIGEAVGLTSTSSVSYMLSTLQKKGYLHRDVGRPRTVEVRLPGHRVSGPDLGTEQENLLLRVYIPSARVYAAEASRLLSLFRDWFTTTRGHGVRQSGYRTSSGEMYEFYADASVSKSDLHQQFNDFSNFLALCSENPSAAINMLGAVGVKGASRDAIVTRFGKEALRLQVDLKHERERRVLTLKHSLEEELLEKNISLQNMPNGRLNALLEGLIPDPSTQASLALLAAP